MKNQIMKIFWSLPVLSNEQKEKIYYVMRKLILNENYLHKVNDKVYKEYTKQILSLPDIKNSGNYVPLNDKAFERQESDPKLIAYYLPQFYPFKENDEWWGKGTTEWNNVSKAVPQFIGHYQPRLPGELGYYDLRIKENIERQIELAKLYGVYGFCYYYYWFDGKRLLDKPLDLFLESKEIDFPFCLCWANENWTRRFDSTSGEVIMKQSSTVESYKEFIKSLEQYVTDKRYMKINGKKVLVVYQPTYIPECKQVLQYWREYFRKNDLGELYLIGVRMPKDDMDFLAEGFDAVSEFQPGSLGANVNIITEQFEFANNNFYGKIFDYSDIVENKKYLKNNCSKLYKAVMPMWDNTARRNNKGNIFINSTPNLYEKWLQEVIQHTSTQNDLDDKLVFINAWNEWGEGTYLEPDRKYGYAYLQATRNAIEKSR